MSYALSKRKALLSAMHLVKGKHFYELCTKKKESTSMSYALRKRKALL